MVIGGAVIGAAWRDFGLSYLGKLQCDEHVRVKGVSGANGGEGQLPPSPPELPGEARLDFKGAGSDINCALLVSVEGPPTPTLPSRVLNAVFFFF